MNTSQQFDNTGGHDVQSLTLSIAGDLPIEGADMWEALVCRMRENDPAAFETAINVTREPAWRLSYQMLGDAHLAQDVLQDAYVAVVTRLDSLREARAFRSWFLGIVLNRCRNALRHRRRHPLADGEKADAGHGFEDGVIRRMAVSRALGELTPVERGAVLLRDYLQLSYQEMAQVLSVPLGTVKSRLNQARRQLMRRLKEVEGP